MADVVQLSCGIHEALRAIEPCPACARARRDMATDLEDRRMTGWQRRAARERTERSQEAFKEAEMGGSKLTAEQRESVGRRSMAGERAAALAEEFGISPTYVRMCAQRIADASAAAVPSTPEPAADKHPKAKPVRPKRCVRSASQLDRMLAEKRGPAMHPDAVSLDDVVIPAAPGTPGEAPTVATPAELVAATDAMRRVFESLGVPADPINHPDHYTSHPSGVEAITITEHMNFCVGNAIKYLMRCDHKGNPLEDLRKARWYVDREIRRREIEAAKATEAA